MSNHVEACLTQVETLFSPLIVPYNILAEPVLHPSRMELVQPVSSLPRAPYSYTYHPSVLAGNFSQPAKLEIYGPAH